MGDEAQDLRLAAPAPRGLHRPVLEVLPQLRRRALAGGDGGRGTATWRGSWASPTSRREKKAVARRISAFVRAGRVPVRDVHRHRDARPGAGRRGRGHRGHLRRRHARWTRRASPSCDWEQGARVPERAAGAEPHHAGLLRHRRPPGQLRRAPAAARRVHALQLQRQDRPGGDHAGAEPPAGDPRLLRAHDLVHPEDAQAGRHRAGRRAGRARGSSTSTASRGRARGPSSAATIPRIRSTRSATRRPICRCIRIRRATG